MQNSFSTEIKFTFLQKVYKKAHYINDLPEGYTDFSVLRPEYRKAIDKDEVYICAKDPTDFFAYDAFEEPEIIPSLVQLVDRVNNGGNKKEMVKKWVERWGFLEESASFHKRLERDLKNLNSISALDTAFNALFTPITAKSERYFEKLSEFWDSATQFVHLWRRYQQITNREIKKLQEWISFEEKYDLIKVQIDGEHFTNATNTMEDIKKDPLYYYQIAGFLYLVEKISVKARLGMQLDVESLLFESTYTEDFIKVMPKIKVGNLRSALYLRFFLLLCQNNQKICALCGRPFIPTRSNNLYCSEQHKRTAKSRRQRQRKTLQFLKGKE
ncbi:hypothetical protein ABE237_22475 [Brevibacillus formosus]|uniref:hypothetical protein n=1 Tax=Brevibacillus formosus TaxID=54913 RepID=UPI0018CDC71C|nr:hypothetical protein [Brevibacillus formosus]MBG9941785.1 hypothetical protein [Brevibacillus formosus]